MREIKEIVDYINEEVAGAESYAKKALRYKTEDKTLADMYNMLATQETSHVDVLHAQVVRFINKAKAEGQTVPASMQAVWDWEHEKIVDNMSRVKMILDMYKGK